MECYVKGSIAEYLNRQGRVFAAQARNLYRNPGKKNVHDLRVTNRRIRVVLWLAGHSHPGLSFKKLQISLHKLGQALGECRELDVAVQDAARYQLVVKKLKSRRRMARKSLRTALSPKQRKKTIKQITKAEKKLKKYSAVSLNPGIHRLRSRIDPWVQKSEIKDRDLHELRIATKKTRYAFEAIGKPVQPLRRLQNLLGRGHDLEVLQEHLGKNKKIQSDVIGQYQKARREIQPALRFALAQLEANLPL